MIKLDSSLDKPFVKFILWFLTGLFIIFYGILNVDADEVAVYGVQFNWCNEYTDYCSVNSNVLYGENAKMTLKGAMNAVDYNQKKFDYLAGIRFWSEITGQTNDVVSLYYTLTLTGLQETETYSNTSFNSKGFYYTSSNVTLLNAKLLSNTYVEDSNPTNIDGNPVYLGTQTIKFKVNVQLNQNFEDSSLYVGIGSFSNANGQSSIIVYQHIADVVTIFAENYYTIDNNSTIINQNDTIINQNQTIIDQNNQTNNELGDINDNITNDKVSGVEDSFTDFKNFLDENSTITQLITLPITLYTSILQGISSSCQPFNLGSLYGENLSLPCVNIGNYLGSTLWGMIDLIISGFSIYFISKKFIKIFDNFSSMKEGDVIND